jgi:AraC family transcriptional regulator
MKASTGRTPHQFVLELRIQKARRLLEETSKPLVQVMLESGFNEQGHFTKAFQRSEGITPGAYRRAVARD